MVLSGKDIFFKEELKKQFRKEVFELSELLEDKKSPNI